METLEPSNDDENSSHKERLELRRLEEKHRLECRKIEAEIREVSLPIWKKPAFYSAIMPVGLAFAGVIFSWSSGWFDAQQKRLDAQTSLLDKRKLMLEDD